MSDHSLTSAAPVQTKQAAAPALQRACACGQHSYGEGECAACKKRREGALQRAAAGAADGIAPPIVHEVLGSPGQPLDGQIRAAMEPRFGHDFSQVRVHTGPRAAESARAVNALAYTVGQSVVFGGGQYAPGTRAGRWLLAHELAHTVQQEGRCPSGEALPVSSGADPSEREADAVAHAALYQTHSQTALTGSRLALARLSASVPQPPAVLSRAQFEKVVKQRFGIERVAVGTHEEQRRELIQADNVSTIPSRLPGWQPWQPEAMSPLYALIVQAFEEFSAGIGGLPVVREIRFYNAPYSISEGVVKQEDSKGASVQQGVLSIYRRISKSYKEFPNFRNEAKNVPIADLKYTPQDTAKMRGDRIIIAHELAHIVSDALVAPDSPIDRTVLVDYMAAVGWSSGYSSQLYDIGVPEVAAALSNGKTPPAAYRIDEKNWSAPQWKEQPPSEYAVASPQEDFGESVAAFIYAPEVLRRRSPRRYAFIEQRKQQWQPALRAQQRK